MPYYCKHCVTGIGKTRELKQFPQFEDGERVVYFHCTYCDAPDTKNVADVTHDEPTRSKKRHVKRSRGVGTRTRKRG